MLVRRCAAPFTKGEDHAKQMYHVRSERWDDGRAVRRLLGGIPIIDRRSMPPLRAYATGRQRLARHVWSLWRGDGLDRPTRVRPTTADRFRSAVLGGVADGHTTVGPIPYPPGERPAMASVRRRRACAVR